MTHSILIVEDEFIVSMEIEERLNAMGYRIAGTADSGEKALALTGRQRPDLILMDICLKGEMDGITAAEEIRRRFRLPVIFLTAYSEDDTLERAKRAEPYGYILKPFNDRELKFIIEIALYRHEAEKAQRSFQESEERLRLFIDHAPASLAMFDREMHYLSASRRWLNDYKLSEKTLEGLSHYEVFPEISEEWKKIHRRGMAGEVIRAEEDRFDRSDGSAQWLRWEVRPWRNTAGDIGGIIIFTEDITERKKTEELLRNTENRYRQILHTTMDGFFRADRQGRILEANPAYSRMSGYDIPELISLSISDLEASQNADGIELQMLDIITHGVARFETRNRRKDGSVYDVEVSVQAQHENGNIEFVAFLRDITQRKTLERIQDAKLRLIDLAPSYSTREFLQELLDVAEALTGSEIGFFHFVDQDQETLSLQTWSTNTLATMCTAKGSGSHYPISQAGVWVDCVKEQKSVIHNDYASLPHKKGLPEGHAPVTRELVVPVLRNGKTVAILGVGNKKTEYHPLDIDTVRQIADLSWETIILKRAEDALRESEEKYRSMMEAMNDGAYICSPDFRIEYLNPAMIRQIGRDAFGEICHEAIYRLDAQCPWCAMSAIQKGERAEIEIENPKDGRFYTVSNSPIFHSTGLISKMAVYRDITRIKNTELRLWQAQKSEAIGTLAAGIAHDFNNILFPITGYAELLVEDLPTGSPERENAAEILQSAKRATDLVKQILSFSRQGEKTRTPILMHPILKEVYKLMRSTIPSNIPLNHSIRNDCPLVSADPTQVHQIVMNLVTNAYHAVEENGGDILLELRQTPVTENDPTGVSLPPGQYAVISVSDTGKGIDPDKLDKIFEPYFTTKKEGKGTGLGLSVVYGIVKDHGGDIRVLNEPGKGVRFDVFLPVHEKNMADDPKTEGTEVLPTGNERILLVDDEVPIVKFETEMLRRLGYQVSDFTDSVSALDSFRADPDGYDLIVSDMAMPHITGAQLVQEIRSVRPGLPIIIRTGYSERLDEEKAKALGINGFLAKPVKKTDMARMVRMVLDDAYPQKSGQ